MVQWVALQCVIVVFPDHTHLLLDKIWLSTGSTHFNIDSLKMQYDWLTHLTLESYIAPISVDSRFQHKLNRTHRTLEMRTQCVFSSTNTRAIVYVL